MTVEMPGLDPDRMVVLSLKSRFAEAILAGVKIVELRRTVPRIVVPTRALLYAASPARALLGTCIITSVQRLDFAALWREHGSGSALLYHEFQQYFEGVDVGAALTRPNRACSAGGFLSKTCERSPRASARPRASPTSTPRPAISSSEWP